MKKIFILFVFVCFACSTDVGDNYTSEKTSNCILINDKDNSYTISCDGDSIGVLQNGRDGENGVNGENCSVTDTTNPITEVLGYKLLCGNDLKGVVWNGVDGANGSDGDNGIDGENCSVTDTTNPITEVSGYKLLCGNDLKGVVWNGVDGKDAIALSSSYIDESSSSTLSESVSTELKNIVTVCSDGCDYSNIAKAIREKQTNTIFKLSAETFDIESAYKEEYGEDFFTTYTKYADHPEDPMFRGLNLGHGCELHGQPNTQLKFFYNGTNEAVSKYFSVVSLTENNVVNSITFNIGGTCRYAIHDDFAMIAGFTNVVEHCVFKGSTSDPGRPYLGAGMGRGGAYIYRNCIFEGLHTRAIGIHNNVGNALGRVEIYNCFAGQDIYVFHYGTSTEKTPVMIHDCKARSINLTWADKSVYPNENMELFAWNNEID